jgi:hypothetical protein
VLTFHADITGNHEHTATQPFAVLPFEAAGVLVMVVEQGDGWIANETGQRVAVVAPHVVVWSAGDRVEYGTDRNWVTRDFWGPREQEQGFHPGG